jgi:hypothetical protein
MDEDRAWYVFGFYRHLVSEQERLAFAHLVGTMKAVGGDDVTAQQKAKGHARS